MKKLALVVAALFLFSLPMTLALAQSQTDNCGGGGGGTIGSITQLQSGNCTNVPEPNTFVLLAAGLGALGILFVFRQYRASRAGGR